MDNTHAGTEGPKLKLNFVCLLPKEVLTGFRMSPARAGSSCVSKTYSLHTHVFLHARGVPAAAEDLEEGYCRSNKECTSRATQAAATESVKGTNSSVSPFIRLTCMEFEQFANVQFVTPKVYTRGK